MKNFSKAYANRVTESQFVKQHEHLAEQFDLKAEYAKAKEKEPKPAPAEEKK